MKIYKLILILSVVGALSGCAGLSHEDMLKDDLAGLKCSYTTVSHMTKNSVVYEQQSHCTMDEQSNRGPSVVTNSPVPAAVTNPDDQNLPNQIYTK
jgi:hypothetical protein